MAKADELKGLKRINCTLCNGNFACLKALKLHTEAVHLKLKNHSCDLCQNKFSYEINLKRHIAIVHEKLKKFNCKFCNRNFSLEQHIKIHNILVHEKLKKYNCIICNRNFSLAQGLQQHTKNIHEKIKKYKCVICNGHFSSLNGITAHSKDVHKIKNPHKCKFCSKQFPHRSGVLKHTKIVHKQKNNSNTEDFRTKEDDFELTKIITKKLAGGNKTQIDNSKQINSMRTINCEIEPSKNNNLQAKNKEMTTFKCEKCFLEFSFQFQLQMHLINAHFITNEKNEVPLDVKPLKENEALKEVEAKVRRFSCHLCELQFSVRENLKFHVENDHSQLY